MSKELKKRLASLDMTLLDDYPVYRKYLQVYLREYDSVIVRYEYILEKALKLRKVGDVSLLDFGGGTGILSFLALLHGVGSVTFQDINPEMCEGASIVAKELGFPLKETISGGYEDIDRRKRYDVIINYDVLEHLYRPIEAFQALGAVLNPGGTILMASGANWLNPVILFFNTRRQLLWEKKGTPNMVPRREARRRIILELHPELCGDLLDLLTRKTRGLRRDDIQRAVAFYLKTGILPKPPFWTDTCDPETGNWGEHSVNFFGLAKRLRESFDVVRVEPGYYPESGGQYSQYDNASDDKVVSLIYPWMRLLMIKLAPLWNMLIRRFPGVCRYMVAPYYLVQVKKVV